MDSGFFCAVIGHLHYTCIYHGGDEISVYPYISSQISEEN